MKRLAGFLSVLMVVLLLGGCYKADTTMRFGVKGDVDVTASVVASKEMYELAQGTGPDNIITEIEAYGQYYGGMDGEISEHVCIDGNGNVLEDGSTLPEDGSMVGTRLKMHFNSAAEAVSSPTLQRYLVVTPLSQNEDGEGLKLEEKRSLFGTTYAVSGKIDLYGNSSYKSFYDSAEQNIKDQITNASAKLTFAFPFSIAKSNADKASFLGTELTWTVDANAPQKDVYFEATVINPVILAMGAIILILAILLIITACKKGKKDDEPDAYFVDEEGNRIPVFDSVEEAGEETEEAAAEEADAVEEIFDKAEEVVEDIVEEVAEEKTENE